MYIYLIEIRIYVCLGSQCLGYNILLFVVFSLIFSYHTLLDQLVNIGMIHSYLPEHSVSEQVRPAVTYVGHI